MKRTPRPPRRLGEVIERPAVFAWVEMAGRMEAQCPYDHTRRSRDGDHFCARCCDLFKFALVHATCDGEVSALVLLERLLGALEGTGEKAA